MTEYEIASLDLREAAVRVAVAQAAIALGVGSVQCVLIWRGLYFMRQSAESRDKGLERQGKADEKRHKEAFPRLLRRLLLSSALCDLRSSSFGGAVALSWRRCAARERAGGDARAPKPRLRRGWGGGRSTARRRGLGPRASCPHVCVRPRRVWGGYGVCAFPAAPCRSGTCGQDARAPRPRLRRGCGAPAVRGSIGGRVRYSVAALFGGAGATSEGIGRDSSEWTRNGGDRSGTGTFSRPTPAMGGP